MTGRVLLGPSREWTGGDVFPHTSCVLAPNPSPWTLEGTNTWIVGTVTGGCLVVDPGPLENGHLAAVEDRIESRRSTVKGVLLTHGHVDHSAGAEEFARRHGVWVRAWDPRLARAASHRMNPEVLSDGEKIEVDGLDVRVVSTPGHSSDSVSLVAADTVLTGDTVLGRGTTVIVHPDGRLAEYLDSLRSLSHLCEDEGISTLLPGHGPPIEDPKRVLDAYWEHRMTRLQEVRAAMKGGATTVSEIVDTVYADVPQSIRAAAESSVRAQVEYLEGSDV